MIHKKVAYFFLVAMIALCGRQAGRAQNPTGADARAKDILAQARAALGGEAALKKIRSVSASGSFIIGIGEQRATGQIKLDWLLPAMLMRNMKWSAAEGLQVTTTEVVNGPKVWTAARSSRSGPLPGVSVGGGGTGRGGSGGGAESKKRGADPAPDLRGNAGSPEFESQMRNDLNCLLIALFFDENDFPPDHFVYAGEMNLENVRTDVLKIKAGGGTVFTLAIDRNTHRPFMTGYQAAGSITSPRGPTHIKYGEDIGKISEPVAQPVEIQIYFSDYRPVQDKKIGQLWLPHQVNRSRDGIPEENVRFESFKLNPSLKPEQFEKIR